MGTYTTGNSTTSNQQICLIFPPKVNSPGLLALLSPNEKLGTLMDYSGPRIHLQIILAFLLTQLIHTFLKHFRLPIFVSQILAGIVLGPMVLKRQHSFITMSEDSIMILGTVAYFGYVFYLFLSGVKMDVGMIHRSGRKALCMGILTVVLPLIACLLTGRSLNQENQFFKNKRFFLAITYSGTSFPVIHGLLSELKLLNSELGRLALSTALVGDLVSQFLIVMSNGVLEGIMHDLTGVLRYFGSAIFFIASVVFCFRPLLKWMVRRTPEGGQIRNVYLYTAILTFLISHSVTETIGLFVAFGPFIVGLAVPAGPPLGSALVEKMDPVISGLLMPLFATTCGMRIDFSYLNNSSTFAKHQAIAALVTLIVKFGVSFLVPFLWNIPATDSLAFAFIMITKGVVELASYSSMHDSLSISQDIFAFMTIIILFVAAVVPILVRTLYNPSRKYVCYEKRSIMHCKLNEELQILTCIHVPANVSSVINLLHASCPTRQNPVALKVLHLIKLSGRATPLFIAHDQRRESLPYNSYSENVVLAFNRFERDNWGAVSAKVFTAVSPQNLMHDDICNLAMDHLTSFIILPFHRRWCVNGSIESEDQSMRKVNLNVLENAPCSVGILVEVRHRLNRSSSSARGDNNNNTQESTRTLDLFKSSYRIGVIFLGGKDDWEALALAKRMSQDKSVKLTVIHLKAANRIRADDEMLRDIVEGRGNNVRYIEKRIMDGPETLVYLQSVKDEYELFIVGRRYRCKDPRTYGLEDWTEFQELGIIGDLLSSEDFGGNHSVLIVQQRIS